MHLCICKIYICILFLSFELKNSVLIISIRALKIQGARERSFNMCHKCFNCTYVNVLKIGQSAPIKEHECDDLQYIHAFMKIQGLQNAKSIKLFI